jgi:hypothetical protein
MMQTNALSAMRAISSAKRACATRRDATRRLETPPPSTSTRRLETSLNARETDESARANTRKQRFKRDARCARRRETRAR